MRFWRLKGGGLQTVEVLVCAPTAEAAIAAVKADEPMYALAWSAPEVTEVEAKPGAVMLWSVYD